MRRLDNICLIGMPGSGKTTFGKKLAEKLGWYFIDIDQKIEFITNSGLQEVIDSIGDEKFLKLEEWVIWRIAKTVKNCVIATGGSAVYSEKAMTALKQSSLIIFLNVPLEVISERIKNLDTRGIVGLKQKSLKTLFWERLPLYQKYADITLTFPQAQPV